MATARDLCTIAMRLPGVVPARDTDAMLRAAFASVDLSRDAVIVTADHGHVAPGGHGGIEREVSSVPVVLAAQASRRARPPAMLARSIAATACVAIALTLAIARR